MKSDPDAACTAETLLKQFGGNGMHIKQEPVMDDKSSRTPSPYADSTTRTIKCEATSTSAQKSADSTIKVEKMPVSRRTALSIDMTSAEITEFVR